MDDDKYAELDMLLEKTTVYSEFLRERLNERSVPEADEGPKRKRQKKGKDGSKRLRSLVNDAEEGDMDVRRTEVQNSSFRQPQLITGAKMKNYQLAGVEWMVSLYENGINGILADEMGLGKTLQTIGFLCYLRERGVMGPFLIVAPLSVLRNWENEFKKFAPMVPTLLYYGPKDQRKLMAKKYVGREVGKSYPVVITSYELIMRDRTHLSKTPWKYIVIDEAQRIKNFECKLLTELKSYSSANRLLLTGTPLQNNLSELWSLLNFLLPEVFDSIDAFKSWFNFENSEDVSQEALLKERTHQIVSKLHKILRPFLLRRLKVDVEQVLTPKKEFVLYTSMGAFQKKYYAAARENRLGAMLSTNGRRTGGQSQNLQSRFMQMRKACAHPYLFEEVDEHGDVKTETDLRLIQASAKLELCDKLLRKLLSKGHKVLLFSQFTTMLDIIEDMLVFRDLKHSRIDGGTSLEERAAQMDSFNDATSDTSVFLLSTRAGGLGVTLTAADTVIFYDSDFNPQVDLQAMDRCHRIGQTRPVHVYRLVTSGTVEEGLLRLAGEKRKLEQVVVGKGKFGKLPTDNAAEKEFTGEELERLTSFCPTEDWSRGSKAVSDDALDKLVALRSGSIDLAESATSGVTEESPDGDGFEVYDIEPTSTVFADK